MGILDWWCHPFHHCPNSSFDSLEFYLRKNLSWILIGWRASCSGPCSLLMLTWRASWVCARLCVSLSCSGSETPPARPGLPCALAQVQLLFSEAPWALTLGLLKAQPSHRLPSPSPGWSRLDSSPQHLSYSQPRNGWSHSLAAQVRAACGRELCEETSSLILNPGQSGWDKNRCKQPSFADFASELRAGYPMTEWKQYNWKADL